MRGFDFSPKLKEWQKYRQILGVARNRTLLKNHFLVQIRVKGESPAMSTNAPFRLFATTEKLANHMQQAHKFYPLKVPDMNCRVPGPARTAGEEV